jgi:hypothetical protein
MTTPAARVRYYAICTHLFRDSFVVESNFDGLIALECPGVVSCELLDTATAWYALRITLARPSYYDAVVRIIEDAVTVENLLAGVEIPELS